MHIFDCMKPKAIFYLDEDALELTFGPDESTALSRLVDLPYPALVPARFEPSSDVYEDVEVMITGWGTRALTADVLDMFPRLRFIGHAAGSIKAFATPEMWERGIRVTSAARANAIPVAEFALSQIVFCLKHGWQRVREIEHSRLYRKNDDDMPGCYHSTVGLLSFGLTGRLVCNLLNHLEVDVLVYDPFLDPSDAAEYGVKLVSLEEVFARSDVISCHTPLLPETHGLLRGEHFRRMKPGATFINTARGKLVNEPEMIEVLQARPDLFAMLDVTDEEPPVPNSPLYTMDNVVLTPHIAGSLGRECRRMGGMVVEDLKRYFAGEELVGELRSPQLRHMA
ncbi:MAG: glycerate dehydrogenase [Puniceicoccaceae bacterium 5H]|nr:MAG: glycerate dehydrogenase [Puniceicoccaceae bacterium 5H]